MRAVRPVWTGATKFPGCSAEVRITGLGLAAANEDGIPIDIGRPV